MDKLPLTTLATLLALLVFFWTLWLVGRARAKYGIAAPAVTGNEMFERCFRIQMNTIEQLLAMLPVLWLCGIWVGDIAAATGGAVWSLGRVIYGLSYLSDPKKRSLGFTLTALPTICMLVATAVFVVRGLI